MTGHTGYRADADADEAVLAAVLEQLTYGLYIVGSRAADGELNGMLADWLMQVSFRPRLLAVALEHTAQTLANLRATGIFSVNLLAETPTGMAVAQQFAQPYADAKIGGRLTAGVHPKFGTVAHTRSAHGCPVLADAIAWVECNVVQEVAAGDHTLVFGQVQSGRLVRAVPPLTAAYTGWAYSG